MNNGIRVLVLLVIGTVLVGCSEFTLGSEKSGYSPTTTYNPIAYRPETTYNPYMYSQAVYSRFYSQGAYAGTSQPPLGYR